MGRTIGLVAGEASGDNLGAGLMAALKADGERYRFLGVGGPRMIAEGLEPLAPFEDLAINVLKEPILRLPQLVRLLRRLIRELDAAALDAFVGVDFNVFNLLLEKALKKRGVTTVHYVSPSVYAWRRGRTRRLARSTDVLLCLYPFEPELYAGFPIEAVFVGHPLADEIDLEAGGPAARAAARGELGLPEDALVLALLPGSRQSEISLMLDDFVAAARFLEEALGEPLRVVIPCINDARHAQIRASVAELPRVTLHRGNARLPLVASDLALVKSGTSTLEGMLLARPMVVSYRLGALSYRLLKPLVRTPFIALPNILAGHALVPELVQDAATPAALAENLQKELDKSRADPEYLARFQALHRVLRRGASGEAARVVRRLIEEREFARG